MKTKKKMFVVVLVFVVCRPKQLRGSEHSHTMFISIMYAAHNESFRK